MTAMLCGYGIEDMDATAVCPRIHWRGRIIGIPTSILLIPLIPSRSGRRWLHGPQGGATMSEVARQNSVYLFTICHTEPMTPIA